MKRRVIVLAGCVGLLTMNFLQADGPAKSPKEALQAFNDLVAKGKITIVG